MLPVIRHCADGDWTCCNVVVLPVIRHCADGDWTCCSVVVLPVISRCADGDWTFVVSFYLHLFHCILGLVVFFHYNECLSSACVNHANWFRRLDCMPSCPNEADVTPDTLLGTEIEPRYLFTPPVLQLTHCSCSNDYSAQLISTSLSFRGLITLFCFTSSDRCSQTCHRGTRCTTFHTIFTGRWARLAKPVNPSGRKAVRSSRGVATPSTTVLFVPSAPPSTCARQVWHEAPGAAWPACRV